jgi:hypothetical protein
MLILDNNYTLQVLFGGQDVAVDFQNLEELTIVQDMKKLLPEFKVRLQDAAGILTHLAPFDKTMRDVSVRFGDVSDVDNQNVLDFSVYRRLPEGAWGPTALYDIRGLLKSANVFAPNFCRGFEGTITSMLQQLAAEMGILSTQISSSLNYVKTFIQPNWNNRTLLNYLERELLGSDNDGGYNIFVKVAKGKPALVCQSHKDMMLSPVRYKFMVRDDAYQDYLPILDYQIEDNYGLCGIFGARNQEVEYVDYFTTEKKTDTYPVTDMVSLTDYYLVDGDDTAGSDSLQNNGRSNDFTRDFQGKTKSAFYGRLMELSKFWMLTYGLPNVCPGDVVQVMFAHAMDGGNLARYQFAGLWVVERVVHSVTDTFRTKLLLRRSGIDTDVPTTLIKSQKKRR